MRTFTQGETLFEKGLDMKCNEVNVIVVFVRYIKNPEIITCHDGKKLVQDCIIRHDGITIISDTASLIKHNP